MICAENDIGSLAEDDDACVCRRSSQVSVIAEYNSLLAEGRTLGQ